MAPRWVGFLALILVVSLLAGTVEGNVDMDPGQLNIMLDMAGWIPGLQTLSVGPWTLQNLRGSCSSPNLAAGVQCASDNSGYVSVINLLDSFIGDGRLSGSIGGLTKLTTLAIAGPTGSIPPQIANTALESFFSSPAYPMAGTIPTMPSTLKSFTGAFQNAQSWTPNCLPQSMESIHITSYNFSNDGLPAEIFTMSSLKELQLTQVYFDGSAPDFSPLTSLTYLEITTPLRISDVPMGTFNLADWSSLEVLIIARLAWVASLPTTAMSSLKVLALDDLPFFSGTLDNGVLASSSLEVVFLTHLPLVTGNLPAPPSPRPPRLIAVSLTDMGLNGTADLSWLSVPGLNQFFYAEMPHATPKQWTWPTNAACASSLSLISLYVLPMFRSFHVLD